MPEQVTLRLQNTETTGSAGRSLAATLYSPSLTIALTGLLGAGKTTFLQGFAGALGVGTSVVSPTFALEQRHPLPSGGEFLHIDLYRLSEKQAREFLASNDDHEGIRCIEWADRCPALIAESDIHLHFEDRSPEETGRTLTVTFNDISFPSDQTISQWRTDVRLPSPVIAHCDAVASFSERIALHLLSHGTIVRTLAVKRAAAVHDLLRFVDFDRGQFAAHVKTEVTDDHRALWKQWQERYTALRHEAACAAFLREQNFDAIATIVETHGLRIPPHSHATIEQKILFYSDKRLALDRIVSLTERFEDFTKRYGSAKAEESRIWFAQGRSIETELFPDGVPF
ncbi:MAG: tRNA (adenosine(37)-N6)-threonylcarbamoyltransferase complex ATPase subunit type 1 TsaE [Candidatus Peregrinibacteria bacterium]